MAKSSTIKIFISYAHKDGADLARRLQKDLKARGYEVWLDTHQIKGPMSWTKEIETALDAAQVVLVLLTPGSYTSEICRAEQLRSLRKGKCVIPLLARQASDVPLHLETKNCRDFTYSRSYASRFSELLQDIHSGRGVKLKQEYRQTYVTAPPLPANFVERPRELKSLRDVLVSEGGTRHIALTALQGMAGIGKTVLAQALCHDEVVQEAFPDGIIWITMGKESAFDLTTRMREVGRALNDDLANYTNTLACINQYRTTMRNKSALIVVDDIWNSRDIEPFLAESPRSRLLFTTRNASIAAAVGAQDHTTGLLTMDQSWDIFSRWAGLDKDKLPPQTEDLIHECGKLPLALAMIGAMLRGKPPALWSRALALLRNADLESIRTQFPYYLYPSLFRAIQVSVEALETKYRERYLALAVLLEDMPVSLQIQQTLWKTDENESLETAEQLVSRSLAQREGDSAGIRLHDLQLDYVRAQYPDRESLGLIHGAVRLSSHVFTKDQSQFASQLLGRLLTHTNRPSIQNFATSLAESAPRPWLRLLWSALVPAGGELIRILEGHLNGVNDVALSPDGCKAISASSDNTLRLWDLENGSQIGVLEGHSRPVNGVAMSSDGRLAVSASDDNTLKVWDLDTGLELRTLVGHSGAVYAVAISPDGRRAVSACVDGTLKLWELAKGRELRTMEGHSGFVFDVAITPDGRRAISASADKTLKVWDLESGEALRSLVGHSDYVYGVAMTPDGRRMVSASVDHTLKVWDLETGSELETLEGHLSSVYGVATSPDGRRVVSASADHTLKIWDLESGRALRSFLGHSHSVYGVAVSPDGRSAVSASVDNTLRVWDLESGCEPHSLTGHSGGVYGVAVNADGRRAVSASVDNTLKVWNLESGHELHSLDGHSSALVDVAISPDGQWAVSASGDNTLKVWDLENGRELRSLVGHSGSVFGVALSFDGQQAVSASDDKTLKVWDLESGRELRTLAGHSGSVWGVAVSPDGRYAVSASDDATLKIWDLRSGQELRTLKGHSSYVSRVLVSPDGKHIVSASLDNTLKIWDLESGHELRSLAGHSSSIWGIAISPSGQQLVSASDDKTLKAWDLKSGTILATFTCESPAFSCAFARNSNVVMVGDAVGRIYFLSLELKLGA